MKSKTYRWVSVKVVNVKDLISRLAEGRVWVGLDVGKEHTMVVVRDSAGTMFRPWKVCQPGEIQSLVVVLEEIGSARPVVVAMEPTGTYGDPLRQALTDAKLDVHRVSPKATKDYSEVFDGVPSQHDGKDAAVVAELAAIGKSQPWALVADENAAMSHTVQWMDTQQDILVLWLGRLEGLLAKYWPELTGLLKLNSVTLLRLLIEYGGPLGLHQDPEAGKKLSGWGGTKLCGKKIQAVLKSAESTVGVRMQLSEVEFVKRCAQAALTARQEIQQSKRSLKASVAVDSDLYRVGEAIGLVTACVLFVMLGNPRNYSCGEAYRKAMGLNLKERSSGKHQGRLKITKRGPALVRRWLYFAALRLVQGVALKPWYKRKKSQYQERGGKAIVALMRKLALAVYAVGGGATFDAHRLFPGRPTPAKEKVHS